MKVLMIGDVVARPGRVAVLERIQDLREQHGIDLAVMNAENVAGGFSITPPLADELFRAGIDVMTSGNHIYEKREGIPYIERQPPLLRPANSPPNSPGSGLFIGEVRGTRVAVLNVIGRVFMGPADDPFRAADAAVSSIPDDVKVRLVDVHAEATSEKAAMGWFLDGRVSAVVGTHTHVQTADERILPGGTAFITDLGMTGAFDSCIGMRHEEIVRKFLTKRPHHYQPAKANPGVS